MAKNKKKKKNEEREFPDTIHVTIDPNLRDSEPSEFNAYANVEGAVEEDGPTRVAKYRFVREGTFRKQTIED